MFRAIQLRQENIVMYMTKMKISDLENISMVMHYDAENDTDYQRPPVPAHYRKIAKYFMTEKEPILPSAIIAAMGKEDYSFDGTELEIKNKIRIVDGQHRIEGMKCLKNGYSKTSLDKYNHLNETFELPVIIMIIEKNDDLTEIDAFINLNSKGKKVRTDLAIALKNKKTKAYMDDDEQMPISEEIVQAISMDVAKTMSADPESAWSGLIIQADEVGKRNEQPISIIAFSRSITPIVEKYFEIKTIHALSREQYDCTVDYMCEVVEKAWNLVIEQWPNCFGREHRYNSSYNICKGIGVNTLFGVFSDCYDDNEEGYIKFKNILEKTDVKEEDWLVGGTFTGYASYQGFSMIKKFILGRLKRSEF